MASRVLLRRRVIYRCATTAALVDKEFIKSENVIENETQKEREGSKNIKLKKKKDKERKFRKEGKRKIMSVVRRKRKKK